ncbi:hypothetical protein [Variovorax sp. PBS-H4]|uniref:hypothetical protein n=1 Tax=Variovorax sp. PBS-H4 TaxID=434008 RepID=UPI0013A57841|nr:hypothetical protein [Variovorax sp. PBS-H4]
MNRVRVGFTSDYTGPRDFLYVNLAIGQTVRSTAGGLGDPIGNWGTYKRVEGIKDLAGILADPSSNYENSNYVPGDPYRRLG